MKPLLHALALVPYRWILEDYFQSEVFWVNEISHAVSLSSWCDCRKNAATYHEFTVHFNRICSSIDDLIECISVGINKFYGRSIPVHIPPCGHGAFDAVSKYSEGTRREHNGVAGETRSWNNGIHEKSVLDNMARESVYHCEAIRC